MSSLVDAAREDTSREPEGLRAPGDPGPAPPGWRFPLAAALAAVSVVCAALLVWLLAVYEPDAARSAGGASVTAADLDDPGAREEVMSLTDQFVKRLGTYSPDMVDDSGQMPEYREQVREVITSKFAADFDKQVTTAEQLVAQAGITRSTEVFATAVSSIDDDSARVLVAGAFSDTYTQGTGEDQETTAQEPLPFRFTVDLVTVDGEWLVDDFSPVGGAPTQAGDGSTGGAP